MDSENLFWGRPTIFASRIVSPSRRKASFSHVVPTSRA